ncbi:MAG: glycosyltransferase 61 family protein [Cyanobium sp.]
MRSLPLPKAPEAPYLYLSRVGLGPSSHRTLANEKLIIAALEPLGFEVVEGETLSPGEQIALLAQARVILGPVGSAFALSGLAAAGASIVEILPPPAAHSWIFRSSANFEHLYGCVMAAVIPESQKDLNNFYVNRPNWFYTYQADPAIVAEIGQQAIQLST